MAAAFVPEPLKIEKGASLRRIVTLKDSTGAAVNLTGCSATAHIRSGTPDNPGSIVLNASTAATRLEIYGAATNGQLLWTASAADTAAMTAGDYFQEWWVTFTDASVERPLVRYVQVRGTGANP